MESLGFRVGQIEEVPERFEASYTGRDKQPKKVVLERISAEQREGKELLGESVGVDLGHCMYLGAKHCSNFLERVKWFYVKPEANAHLERIKNLIPSSRVIEFYAEKSEGGKR